MKNFLKLLPFVAVLLFWNCEEDLPAGSSDIVTFESGSPTEFVQVSGTRTASVKIYTGNISSSDRSFGISVDESTTLDASAYSVPSSVTVPGGTNEGVLEYQITDSNISLAGGTLVLNISDAGDLGLTTGARSYSSISIDVQYEECPPANTVELNIVFDAYPGETSWDIFLASDLANAIASGDGYGGMASIDEDFCIESDDYVFVIYDAFGDGICCAYGQGSYTLTVDGAVVASGGSFGASESTNFTVQ
ncbi:MAG: hypothetical protein HKN40_04915 [Winogradskyella sp.]|uniref:hypothetical protein n=1 Tax=Winogradskyella sp. TaxID=1883156 RepID=UPI0017F914E8|nr:hypothetical protein [Winogradskyella sp.]